MTNRLSKESSPYLLQHANNPVEWYPWGEEALSAAKESDLPILQVLDTVPATGAMLWKKNLSKTTVSLNK